MSDFYWIPSGRPRAVNHITWRLCCTTVTENDGWGSVAPPGLGNLIRIQPRTSLRCVLG